MRAVETDPREMMSQTSSVDAARILMVCQPGEIPAGRTLPVSFLTLAACHIFSKDAHFKNENNP